jgi:hypothetical protein
VPGLGKFSSSRHWAKRLYKLDQNDVGLRAFEAAISYISTTFSEEDIERTRWDGVQRDWGRLCDEKNLVALNQIPHNLVRSRVRVTARL